MNEPILYASVRTPELVGKVRVFVDDQEVKACIWADVQKGECEAFQLDANGLKCLDSTGKDAARHIVRGKVRIERIA